MTPSCADRTAVFLDRDGTLIEDRGWLRDPAQVELYPATIPALQQLGGAFELFIVTQQRGVADGLLSLADVQRVNNHVVAVLRTAGVVIQAAYCCPPARGEGCACAKPKPFFLQQAARDYGIDLGCSFVVGDHPSDVEMAANAGARGIYVLTGHGTKHRAQLAAPSVVVQDIGEAAAQVLAMREPARA